MLTKTNERKFTQTKIPLFRGRPNRNTVITKDEIINLIIIMNSIYSKDCNPFKKFLDSI